MESKDGYDFSKPDFQDIGRHLDTTNSRSDDQIVYESDATLFT